MRSGCENGRVSTCRCRAQPGSELSADNHASATRCAGPALLRDAKMLAASIFPSSGPGDGATAPADTLACDCQLTNSLIRVQTAPSAALRIELVPVYRLIGGE
jgi:hypothetical protein